jgi:sirohydrochlorin ferrochelatase
LPAVAVAALGAGPRQVVLAAHGSARGKAAGEAAWSFAERLARLMPQTAISLGFVEQAPGVAEAAGGLDNDAVCLPWLAFPGGHFQEDVPQALAEAGFSGRLLPVLGLAEGVPALIAASLLAASQKDIAA